MSSISHLFGTRAQRGQRAGVVDAAFAVSTDGGSMSMLGTVGTRQVVVQPGTFAAGCTEQGHKNGQAKRQNTPIPGDTGAIPEQPTE